MAGEVTPVEADSLLTYEDDRRVVAAWARGPSPATALFLVRHADAGDRGRWDAPDHWRPLSPKGQSQAERVGGAFASTGVTRLLSSPAVRCVQTLEPLAARLGLVVEESEALAEGEPVAGVLRLVEELAGESAVLCSHGDLIPLAVDALGRRDGLDLPPGFPCAKGSTWALERDAGGRFSSARYLPAP